MDILKFGNKVLRKRADRVVTITPGLRQLADSMLDSMYDTNGIGLAAPQIGHSIRLIVVDVAGDDEDRKPYIMFNPEVISSRGECTAEEGCLSIPGVWADVTRPEFINVTYMDEFGKTQTLENVDGMFARCIQHEIDHLEGVLFTDKISATDRTLNEPKLKKLAKESK
jgi:peptide deformylase